MWFYETELQAIYLYFGKIEILGISPAASAINMPRFPKKQQKTAIIAFQSTSDSDFLSPL